MGKSDIPNVFDASWYDYYYFADPRGKAFRRPNGSIDYWGYRNLEGWWDGAVPIAKAWKTMFNPRNMLDVGCGRGAFTLAARNEGIEAYGFDFSEYAINNLCPGCRKEWFRVWDATKTPWPYGDESFDLCVALDFFEHLYSEDIPKVADEMYRVAKKWVFLQIAVVGGGSGPGRHEKGYILRKGEPVPVELEGNAVAGHCTVQPPSFWYEKLDRDNVLFRRDLVEYFKALVPQEVIRNWVQNLILVVEVLS
jgi:SAM-dependent methyltransferase